MSISVLLPTQSSADYQGIAALQDTVYTNQFQLCHQIVPGNAVMVLLSKWALQVTSVSFVTLTTFTALYNPIDISTGVLCSYTTSSENISKLTFFVLEFLAKQAAFPLLPPSSSFFDFITMTCGMELLVLSVKKSMFWA
ncbi:hypothetical protein WISP_19695 [Willisornis vidua]|uniref:Uncharacterized protein n=1 Tax=Willisornis vidua TaxID=1566151 RepID=A0ABQ9DNR4_9PASS|nr:hypothetical protein WISP_19695 [Willisornis vidua]